MFRLNKMKENMTRFFWPECSSTSNFILVKSETLARLRKHTCSDHICHKYQQPIYEITWYHQFIWGTAQVDFMFGSKLYKNRSALCVARGLGVQLEKIYDTETKCNSSLFQACTALYFIFVMTIQNISDLSAT